MSKVNRQQALTVTQENLDAAGVHANRGLSLLDAGRAREAAGAFQNQIMLTPHAVAGWFCLALALLNIPDVASAEVALRQVLDFDPAHAEANFRLATLLICTHRQAEAEKYAVAGARSQGVFVFPCLSHKIDARILLLQSATLSNLVPRALFDHQRFELITGAILPPDAGGFELLAKLPPYDVIFNCVADADNGDAPLHQVEEFCRGAGRPVLNPPANLRRTRRDLIPSLFEGIPGLVVPKTRRAHRAEVAAMAASGERFDPPLLIRPLASHGGHDLERIEHADKLTAYLRCTPDDLFYLTEYLDCRSADGYWRKYRLIFVDREVFPYHLAIASKWLVHYWRADMASVVKRQEEEAFLADYRTVFSGERGEAVREVARRLDLDYCGLDCAIAHDGRVLVFEANATMLVHLDDPRESFSYKYTYVPSIFDAITAMVNRRLGK